MATAVPTHGSKALLTIGGIALADHLQGAYDFEQDYAVVDTTVYGATGMTNLVSPIQDNKPVQLTCLMDPALHNALVAILGTAGQAFTYGPQGSTTGNAKLTGTGAITNYKTGVSLTGAAIITFTFTSTGAVTWGVY